jgi:CheY-like chemotaxis protein
VNGRSRKKQRVLVAEDNYYSIEGLVDYLTSIGLEILVAVDGEEVVNKAIASRPDLIIMDIQMPKRSGLEVIKMLRSNTTLIEVPIIALTAMTMPGDRERCLDAGANEFVSKPFKLHDIVDKIKEYGVIKSQ